MRGKGPDGGSGSATGRASSTGCRACRRNRCKRTDRVGCLGGRADHVSAGKRDLSQLTSQSPSSQLFSFRGVARCFYPSTESFRSQHSDLFDFVHGSAAALWNMRWQVQGYLSVVPRASEEELKG